MSIQNYTEGLYQKCGRTNFRRSFPSDAAADALSKHKGLLELNGLTSLSDAAADSLSKHSGPLELNGLTSLSDAAADALSKHGNEHLKLTHSGC
jgi:hypothetical protein